MISYVWSEEDRIKWMNDNLFIKDFYKDFWENARRRHEHTIDIDCEVITPKQLSNEQTSTQVTPAQEEQHQRHPSVPQDEVLGDEGRNLAP